MSVHTPTIIDHTPVDMLNIAGLVAGTHAHGPGMRFALWLQGCQRRCDGCINPEMLEVRTAELIRQTAVVDLIRRSRDGALGVTGITVMGGEPVMQAKGLVSVLEVLRREQPILNVILFTGYTLAQLRRSQHAAVHDLLMLVDTLIDGPFAVDRFDPHSIRGSTNQQIHHLTPVLRDADFSRQPAECHDFVAHGEYCSVHTGIPLTKLTISI